MNTTLITSLCCCAALTLTACGGGGNGGDGGVIVVDADGALEGGGGADDVGTDPEAPADDSPSAAAPSDPAPAESTTGDPAPGDPAPSDPVPTDSSSTDPASSDPDSSEPAPTDPVTEESAPAEPDEPSPTSPDGTGEEEAAFIPLDVNGDGTVDYFEAIRLDGAAFVPDPTFDATVERESTTLEAVAGLYDATEEGPNGRNVVYLELVDDPGPGGREGELRVYDFDGDERAASTGVSRNCHIVRVAELDGLGVNSYWAQFPDERISLTPSRQRDGLLLGIDNPFDVLGRRTATLPLVSGLSADDLARCP